MSETIKAHDFDFGASRFGGPKWRPAGEKLHPSNDDVPSFRTCSYCGSMHPEDLLEALKAGAELHMADMKYGWPHKFYVDGVKNLNAGALVRRSSMSIEGPEPTPAERASVERWATKDGCEIRVIKESYAVRGGAPAYSLVVFEPDGPTTRGKFYSVHLKDVSDELLAELAPYFDRCGVRFGRDENGTKYGPVPRATAAAMGG